MIFKICIYSFKMKKIGFSFGFLSAGCLPLYYVVNFFTLSTDCSSVGFKSVSHHNINDSTKAHQHLSFLLKDWQSHGTKISFCGQLKNVHIDTILTGQTHYQTDDSLSLGMVSCQWKGKYSETKQDLWRGNSGCYKKQWWESEY